MKVVIAFDSFKGSMSSMEAGLAAKEGVLAAKGDASPGLMAATPCPSFLTAIFRSPAM
ncbi:MAG: glycerate kinase [Clostridiales bacterium]|nr:glycerate kinase [Clostridiales bacterium]